MSSRVLLGGQGACFDEDHWKGTEMGELGPGVYLRVYQPWPQGQESRVDPARQSDGAVTGSRRPRVDGSKLPGHRAAGAAPRGTRRHGVFHTASHAAGAVQLQGDPS